MIVCNIKYTLDPHKLADFTRYAKRWPPIIERCGGGLIGYFLPKEGANNIAYALVEFENLAAYERYRNRLFDDAEAMDNFNDAQRTGCILVEERLFLTRA